MKSCILMFCFLVCFRSSWSQGPSGGEELITPIVKGSDPTPHMTIATDKSKITSTSNGTSPTSAPTTADDDNVTTTTAADDVATTIASNITVTTAADVGTTTAYDNSTTTADVDKSMTKHTKPAGYSNKTIMHMLKMFRNAAKTRGILADEHANIEQNAAPTTAESIGQTSTIQTTGENDTTTTPSDTLPSVTSTSLPDTTKESSPQDPAPADNGNEDPESQQLPNNGGNNNPGNDDKESESHKSDTGVEKNNPGPRPLNRTPESSHFAVVFLVIIALLFGLYALYHNRQKIIAVVIEGRSVNGRGGRDRYRKLDSESGIEPEARIKNSNEVYVY